MAANPSNFEGRLGIIVGSLLTPTLLLGVISSAIANPLSWSERRNPQDSGTPQWQQSLPDRSPANASSPWQPTAPTSTHPSPTWRERATTSLTPPQSLTRDPATAVPVNAPRTDYFTHQMPPVLSPTPKRNWVVQEVPDASPSPEATPLNLSPPTLSDLPSKTASTAASSSVTSPEPTSGSTVEPQLQSPQPNAEPPTDPPSDRSFISPLTFFPSQRPTAHQLKQGELVINVYNRTYFIPDSVDPNATSIYPNLGLTWGITNSTELTLEGQFVDSGMPYRQGEFQVNTISNINSSRGDIALELKQRLWQNDDQTQGLSGVISLDWADANVRFVSPQTGQIVFQDNVQTFVPSLAFPFTAQVDDRLQLTLSPTVAFFPSNNALFLFRPPVDNPGSFGTTFGLTGGVAYQLIPRLVLWGDAFVPVTGNNSISRSSGKPAQSIAYNAGIRYLINPKVAFDLFATNTYGSRGALALTSDRDFVALGAGISFMPDFIGANRRYADSFNPALDQQKTPFTRQGLGWLDHETLNSGQFLASLLVGPGVFTGLSYGFTKDVEAGAYLGYTFSNIDESEQGISGKLRLLNQKEGAPLTVSLGATLGNTNQPFVNFFNNNRNEFNQRNLSRSVPFVLTTDNLFQGELRVFTVSLNLGYRFEQGSALWLTPIWGYIQRLGTEIAGINAGGAYAINPDVSLVGEIAVNWAGEGNTFIGDHRANAIPWTFAVRWNPASLFGQNPDPSQNQPSIDFFVTNRVGFTPWQQMRVRDQNVPAVGVGISVPF